MTNKRLKKQLQEGLDRVLSEIDGEWDELGIQDPGVKDDRLPFNPEMDLDNLLHRFGSGFIDADSFLRTVVSRLVNKQYGSEQLYTIGEQFNIPEGDISSVFGLAEPGENEEARFEKMAQILSHFILGR